MNEFGRIITAPLQAEFSLARIDERGFRREYDRLAETDEDPIGQWVKLAKARGETRDSDSVLLHLMVELHRKVDDLQKIIKQEETIYLKLEHQVSLEGVGHGIFELEPEGFVPGEHYYGRINLPVFPQRLVPLYFHALDEKRAVVDLMHDRDIKDWDSYIAAKDRALAREQKGKYV